MHSTSQHDALHMAQVIKRGFVSYDALFSILPIMFMVALIIQTMAVAVHDADNAMGRRNTANFLVATADYLVKSGAVRESSSGSLVPGWIDEGKLNDEMQNISISITDRHVSAYIGDYPEDGKTCIYRLVISGGAIDPSDANSKISKLYVCE